MPINKPANIDQSVWDALDEVSKMRTANYQALCEELYQKVIKDDEEFDRLLEEARNS